LETAGSSAANKVIEKWATLHNVPLTPLHGILTALAVPGTARYCRVHNQHRPHLTVVTPWFVRPKGELTDGRFLWVCPTGYLNLLQSVEDAMTSSPWRHYYAPNEKALAVFAKKLTGSPLHYPVQELKEIPW
jgi:hypothetical protein